ncbi:hypothetical protein Hanom_Chr13g01204851 [Helianthus anomalus]
MKASILMIHFDKMKHLQFVQVFFSWFLYRKGALFLLCLQNLGSDQGVAPAHIGF